MTGPQPTAPSGEPEQLGGMLPGGSLQYALSAAQSDNRRLRAALAQRDQIEQGLRQEVERLQALNAVVEAAQTYAAIVRQTHGINIPWQACDDFLAALDTAARAQGEER